MSDNKQNWPNERRQDEALAELSRQIKSRERKAKAAPLGVVAATLAVLVLIVGGIWFAATFEGNDEQDNVADSSAAETSSPEVEPAAMPDAPLEPYGDSVQCTYQENGEAAKEVSLPEGEDVPTSGTREVTLNTNGGEVPLELDNSTSPCTTNSFEHLAKEGYFDNTVCHRAVKSEGMQILQCGDPSGVGSGGPGYAFEDEFPTNGVEQDQLSQPVNYKRGTLAMANSGPNTNGSQFFLVTGDTTLPPNYNVFGTISEEGLKNLDKIMEEKVAEGDGKPESEVKIESAKA